MTRAAVRVVASKEIGVRGGRLDSAITIDCRLSCILGLVVLALFAGCATEVRKHDASDLWTPARLELLQDSDALTSDMHDTLQSLLAAGKLGQNELLMGQRYVDGQGVLPYRPHTMPYRILIAPLRTRWKFQEGADEEEVDDEVAPDTEIKIQQEDEEGRSRAVTDQADAAEYDVSRPRVDKGLKEATAPAAVGGLTGGAARIPGPPALPAVPDIDLSQTPEPEPGPEPGLEPEPEPVAEPVAPPPFDLAVRSLDTWGAAFFADLQSGDATAINRWMLSESDCIYLLGEESGPSMAQRVAMLHEVAFPALMKEHSDLSRGVFRAFYHPRPLVIPQGDQGLTADTRSVWEAELVYEVDGSARIFPVLNLLETNVGWKVVQLVEEPEPEPEPQLSFEQAVQQLDTWGIAFFQALQFGDLDLIQRFVLDEADCIFLLGEQGGMAMSEEIARVHAASIDELLQQHLDLSRAVYKTFIYPDPVTMPAGEQGLRVETSSLWHGALVYEVDAEERRIPVYNLLKAQGQWKILQLPSERPVVAPEPSVALSFEEAIQDLDTWAEAFFAALQSGDRDGISRFALTLDECEQLLGTEVGREQGGLISAAIDSSLDGLLEEHAEISRGVFLAFRHSAPQVVRAGDQGLAIDARTILGGELVYELDGGQRAFPAFNLLQIDGRWKVVQLEAPEAPIEAPAPAQPLPFDEAIRGLGSFGAAFFAALGAGDRAAIAQFVIDEADCVTLLGDEQGPLMAGAVKTAHESEIESLLSDHADLSVANLVEFRHAEPVAMEVGQQGLMRDARALWDGQLVYQLAGELRSFPIFNLIEVEGRWRVVRLRAPEPVEAEQSGSQQGAAEVSDDEAMRDLDTWGRAFFAALQSGDMGRIARFVMGESGCVSLLGEAAGSQMAAGISAAHEATIGQLLEDHPRIDRGVFKAFDRPDPVVLEAGQQGLEVGARGLWYGRLIYEVDGQEHSLSVFNLLEAEGRWQIIQLSAPVEPEDAAEPDTEGSGEGDDAQEKGSSSGDDGAALIDELLGGWRLSRAQGLFSAPDGTVLIFSQDRGRPVGDRVSWLLRPSAALVSSHRVTRSALRGTRKSVLSLLEPPENLHLAAIPLASIQRPFSSIGGMLFPVRDELSVGGAGGAGPDEAGQLEDGTAPGQSTEVEAVEVAPVVSEWAGNYSGEGGSQTDSADETSNEEEAGYAALGGDQEIAGEEGTIRSFEGYEFPLGNDDFQAEVKSLFESYHLFDEVQRLKGTRAGVSGKELLPAALQRQGDLLIEFTLRRNKISYTGVNGLYPLDILTWIVLWWPSWFIPSEDYRCDIEIDVKIWHVRSGEEVFEQTYKATWEGSTSDFVNNPRGWKPWGTLMVPLFGKSALPSTLGESDFADVSESIRPYAWAQVRAQLIKQLAEDFREETLKDTYKAVRNSVTVQPRKFAIIIGIPEYGPKAMGKIRARSWVNTDVAMVSAWVNNARNGFHPDDVAVIQGSEATRGRILDAFRRMRKSVAKDQVLIYFRGECAIVDDETRLTDDGVAKYILPYDVDLSSAESLRETAISFQELARIFNRDDVDDRFFVESRQVAFLLDAPIPGSWQLKPVPGRGKLMEFAEKKLEKIEEGRKESGRTGRYTRKDLGIEDTFLGPQGLLKDEGRFVVMACDFGESLLELAPVQMGAFAYHFFTGLSEVNAKRIRKTESELERDVNLSEVFEYAAGRIKDESRSYGFSKLQRPQKYWNTDFVISAGVRR